MPVYCDWADDWKSDWHKRFTFFSACTYTKRHFSALVYIFLTWVCIDEQRILSYKYLKKPLLLLLQKYMLLKKFCFTSFLYSQWVIFLWVTLLIVWYINLNKIHIFKNDYKITFTMFNCRSDKRDLSTERLSKELFGLFILLQSLTKKKFFSIVQFY